MKADNYMQMMIDSLDMKKNILTKIIMLNEEQTRIVSVDPFDEEAFHENMESKGELIENMLQLDQGFNSVFNRIKEELDGNKSAYKDEIVKMQELIKTVTELGVKVEAQEARNKTLVQNKFNDMKKNLQNAKRSTKMANTYYKNMNKLSYEPQFMDQKN
jgi:predicted nuclease with TOPRIM domain